MGFPRYLWRVIHQIADGKMLKEVAFDKTTTIGVIKTQTDLIRRRLKRQPELQSCDGKFAFACERLSGCLRS